MHGVRRRRSSPHKDCGCRLEAVIVAAALDEAGKSTKEVLINNY